MKFLASCCSFLLRNITNHRRTRIRICEGVFWAHTISWVVQKKWFPFIYLLFSFQKFSPLGFLKINPTWVVFGKHKEPPPEQMDFSCLLTEEWLHNNKKYWNKDMQRVPKCTSTQITKTFELYWNQSTCMSIKFIAKTSVYWSIDYWKFNISILSDFCIMLLEYTGSDVHLRKRLDKLSYLFCTTPIHNNWPDQTIHHGFSSKNGLFKPLFFS